MNVTEVLIRVEILCSRLEDFLSELQHTADKRPSPYAKLRETYPNAGKPWSDADDDALRQAYVETPRVEDLALHFGRTSNGIRQRLERLGLAVPIAGR